MTTLDNSIRYVTLGGECFEASSRGELDPVDRDGLLYKFHLTDMAKSRGKRLVSVFAVGSLELALPDYKQRIQTICLNAIRRAFDRGGLSFDEPSDEHHYKEIQLSASDREEQGTRTDAEVRQYIVQKAYWLAYRFPMQPQPDGIVYPIPFDESADLDYLVTTSTEVRRNIRRLAAGISGEGAGRACTTNRAVTLTIRIGRPFSAWLATALDSVRRLPRDR